MRITSMGNHVVLRGISALRHSSCSSLYTIHICNRFHFPFRVGFTNDPFIISPLREILTL